jgi:hypothetical protein
MLPAPVSAASLALCMQVGYTADSIKKIVDAMDWDLLLSNAASLRSLSIEEKRIQQICSGIALGK